MVHSHSLGWSQIIKVHILSFREALLLHISLLYSCLWRNHSTTNRSHSDPFTYLWFKFKRRSFNIYNVDKHTQFYTVVIFQLINVSEVILKAGETIYWMRGFAKSEDFSVKWDWSEYMNNSTSFALNFQMRQQGYQVIRARVLLVSTSPRGCSSPSCMRNQVSLSNVF